MIPPEPLPPKRSQAFWDYQDIFSMFALLVVTFFALPFLLAGLRGVPQAYLGLIPQAIIYLVALGGIAAILRLRYDRPFWRSLGWIGPRPVSALISFILGIVVVVVANYLGLLMHAEPAPLPFEKWLNSRMLLFLWGTVLVLVGPICEELVFRGFMMPLLIRSLGAAAGIIVTGLLFGALHLFQYKDWRIVLLISSAGVAFGWRRYVTGSTVDSVLMHVGFNLAPFLAISAR